MAALLRITSFAAPHVMCTHACLTLQHDHTMPLLLRAGSVTATGQRAAGAHPDAERDAAGPVAEQLQRRAAGAAAATAAAAATGAVVLLAGGGRRAEESAQPQRQHLQQHVRRPRRRRSRPRRVW